MTSIKKKKKKIQWNEFNHYLSFFGFLFGPDSGPEPEFEFYLILND